MCAEIFNTASWNFLAGNRDVESIIRENPGGSLVVRGGLASILPTVNCLRDLTALGWRDFPRVPVSVPGNAVTSFLPAGTGPVTNGDLFPVLLEKAYGVRVFQRPVSLRKSLIFLVNDPGDNPVMRETLEEITGDGNGNRLMMVLPPASNMGNGLKALAEKAVFATVFDGNNVFFPSRVEEVLWDYEPENIVVMGTDPLRVFYSALGAVDWLIVADSRFRNPQDLKLWDLADLGNGVTAILPPKNGNSAGNPQSIKEAAFHHLKTDLEVISTDDDYRFTPVPDHKIAIDMMI